MVPLGSSSMENTVHTVVPAQPASTASANAAQDSSQASPVESSDVLDMVPDVDTSNALPVQDSPRQCISQSVPSMQVDAETTPSTVANTAQNVSSIHSALNREVGSVIESTGSNSDMLIEPPLSVASGTEALMDFEKGSRSVPSVVKSPVDQNQKISNNEIARPSGNTSGPSVMNSAAAVAATSSSVKAVAKNVGSTKPLINKSSAKASNVGKGSDSSKIDALKTSKTVPRSRVRKGPLESPAPVTSVLYSSFCREDQIGSTLERVMNRMLANRLEWTPRKTISKGLRRDKSTRRKVPTKKRPKPSKESKKVPKPEKIRAKKPKRVKKELVMDGALREMLDKQKSERSVRDELRKSHLVEVLDKMKKRDRYRFFIDPVDAKLVPDYLDIIVKPMDLSTMKKKLDKNKYRCVDAFRKDCCLIFDNCMLYNAPETLYYQQAQSMRAYGERLLDEVKRLVEPEETPPLINPFETIDEYSFPVDAELLVDKVSTSKYGNCSGNHCNSLVELGAFDVNKAAFDSECSDRKRLTECGSLCGCDPNRCLNRACSLERGKRLDIDLQKRDVFGIDSYTHRLIIQILEGENGEDVENSRFIEHKILPFLNSAIPDEESDRRSTHMRYALAALLQEAQRRSDLESSKRVKLLLRHIKAGLTLPVYQKGHGVVCINTGGFKKNEFIAEYMGEVYPPWRWFEKQSVLRAVQKSYSMPFSFGFYNIMLERHKDDQKGYDVLFVDACRKGNFASRLSHSCSPNCTSVVVAADGRFRIVVLALRDIAPGEELTFDYHSVTESLEEQKNAVCFCGWSACRGCYVNYTGPDTFQQVIQSHHGVAQRTSMLLKACSQSLTTDDRERIQSYHLLDSVCAGCPEWLLKFLSLALEFVEFEKKMLPRELLKLRRYGYTIETAEFDTIGVIEGRIQALAIAVDKVKYILRQPGQKQDPPLIILSDEQVFERIWNGDDSVIMCASKRIGPLLDEIDLVRLIECTSVKVHSRRELRTQLLEFRDLLRSMPPSTSSFHHIAADIVHLYAHTDTFFAMTSYNVVKSEPVEITELGLNIADPNDEALLTPRPYTQGFIWGCLMYWFKQSIERPDATAHNSKRGIAVLPSIDACYSMGNKHELGKGYTVAERKAMIQCLKNAPAPSPWPRDRVWDFRATNDRVYGTPLLDAVHTNKDLRPLIRSLQAWTPNLGEKGFFEVLQSPKRRRRRVSRFDDVPEDAAAAGC